MYKNFSPKNYFITWPSLWFARYFLAMITALVVIFLRARKIILFDAVLGGWIAVLGFGTLIYGAFKVAIMSVAFGLPIQVIALTVVWLVAGWICNKIFNRPEGVGFGIGDVVLNIAVGAITGLVTAILITIR